MKIRSSKLAVIAVASFLAVGLANAATITVDEYVYQNGTGVVPSSFSGAVNMSISGSVLTVDLQNTSALMPNLTSGGLGELAGIAFNLPSGVGISGGSAAPASGSTLVGGTTSDMNAQWGYSRASGSGSLSGGAFAYFTGSYNADAATVTADTTASFAGPPANQVDGLNYGAISTAQSAGTVPGHPYIVDTLEITFNLTGTIPSDILTQIENGSVGLMFGSPDTTPGNNVPDGGSTLALMGMALTGVGVVRRKLIKT
jgi:hypothetical protein